MKNLPTHWAGRETVQWAQGHYASLQSARSSSILPNLWQEPGSDFRLPTDAELNALQAYMLSVGRSHDLNFSKMTFTSEIVQRGWYYLTKKIIRC